MQDEDRSFFLCASYTHPHEPFITTREWWDLYDHDAIDMPAAPEVPLDAMHPYDRWLQIHHMVDTYPPDETAVRNARHAFYGMVSYFGHQVGRLLAELERLGLSENTVVVITSDHGVNLTAANHVIHVERWWNPAVEDQATDRVYRIGQDKTVFVHRIIVADTLEERIAALHERKREVSEQVMGAAAERQLQWTRKDSDPIPEPRPPDDYSGKFVARAPKSLHRDLVDAAEGEGVSPNQYINVALAQAVLGSRPSVARDLGRKLVPGGSTDPSSGWDLQRAAGSTSPQDDEVRRAVTSTTTSGPDDS